jgi:hypothetical protein
MIKLYPFLLAASCVFLSTCISSPKTHTARLKFDRLQYGAYRWRPNLETREWELFLAYYLSISKDGSYIAMRHNTTPEPSTYFKGTIDATRFHLFDSLAIVPPDTVFENPGQEIYDGNTCCLQCAGSVNKNIYFLTDNAPPFLHQLSTAMDSVVFQSKNKFRPLTCLFLFRN